MLFIRTKHNILLKKQQQIFVISYDLPSLFGLVLYVRFLSFYQFLSITWKTGQMQEIRFCFVVVAVRVLWFVSIPQKSLCAALSPHLSVLLYIQAHSYMSVFLVKKLQVSFTSVVGGFGTILEVIHKKKSCKFLRLLLSVF